MQRVITDYGRLHFWNMISILKMGWYPARVHPLSSGNGKGNIKTIKAFMVTKKCNNNNGVNNNKTNHKSEGEQPGY